MINRKPGSGKKFTTGQRVECFPSLQHQALLALVFVLLVLVTPGPVIDAVRTWFSLPVSEPVASDFPVDKVMHFVMFAVCSFLSFRAWSESVRPLYLLVAVLIFAAATEFLQTLVPGRSGDMTDFFADTAGVVMGFWWFVRRRSVILQHKKNPT